MRSIRTRLVLLSAGLILMVTAILTGVIAMNASRVLHATLENALSQQIRQGSDLFLNFLKWQSLNLEVWDNQPIVKVFFKSPALAVLSRSGLEAYLSRACDKAPWIADILLVDHDTVLYDHAFPFELSSRQSGQGEVFWTQLSKGQPFLMNLGELHPDQDRWVLVLSRQVSDEGKPEPGRFIALFLDLAQVNKALFTNLAIGQNGFLTFAGLMPDDRMVLPDTTARTDVQREFFTEAAAWNRPRDIPESRGAILLKGTTLPGFPIHLIGVASRQDFGQLVRELITNSLLIGLLTLVIGILGAVVFSNRLTAPLARLTAIIKGITAGEKGMDTSLESSDLSERTDELGVLAGAFCTMLADLRRHTVELEERVALRTADLQQTNTRMAEEINERKNAEEVVKNSEQRLGQIINFLPDPTFVIDREGKVVTWNQAMENLTGIAAADMVGKGNYEYALPFYGERRPILIDLVREWNPEYEKKYLSIKKDGQKLVSESYHPNLGDGGLHLSGNASLIYDAAGQVAGAIESLRNITERKHMEEELRRNVEELERFNKLAIGREIKMIQLKEEINELRGQLNQDKRYKIVR